MDIAPLAHARVAQEMFAARIWRNVPEDWNIPADYPPTDRHDIST